LPQHAISFRPLALTDLDWLTEGLNRPHLRRFFQKAPVSRAEVEAKYGRYIRGDAPNHSHLALLDTAPFAYLQCYRIADYPGWAEMIGEPDGIGIDLAILDPALIGKGLGRAMLALYLRDVAFPLFPAETKCFIAHEAENSAALATSKAVGFRYLRNFLEDGLDTDLLAVERPQIRLSA
jgi:aminoglycoside 6'-N-acetyltransferase